MYDKATKPKVTFFMRNPKAGYSIHAVFKPIIDAAKGHCKVFDAPHHRADPISVLQNIWFAFNHRNKNGINHVTGGTHYLILGLAGCKTVLTIHDLVLLDNCNNCIKKALFKLIWFKLPMKFANAITCISNTTRQHLLNTFNIPDEKVTTIYNPVNPQFTFSKHNFNKECPRILHIGTAWNKNVETVIRALDGIQCELVIIGKPTKSILDALTQFNTSYEIKYDLTEDELIEEYKHCDIVSFPSIYEGFGMPIIEGQSVGRAVLTSNINPMKEIANGAACVVDPHDVASIRNGFLRIIHNDIYRKELVTNGKENSKRFSAKHISDQYAMLYSSLIASQK